MAARPTPYEGAPRCLVAGGCVVRRQPRGLQYVSLVLDDEFDELMGERDAFHDLGVVSCVGAVRSALGVVELPHSVEDQVGSIALLLESRAHLVRAEAADVVEFIFQLFGQPPGAETYHFERAIMIGVPRSR